MSERIHKVATYKDCPHEAETDSPGNAQSLSEVVSPLSWLALPNPRESAQGSPLERATDDRERAEQNPCASAEYRRKAAATGACFFTIGFGEAFDLLPKSPEARHDR